MEEIQAAGHDALIGRSDAVAGEPRLELEVHVHGTVGGCCGRGLEQLLEARPRGAEGAVAQLLSTGRQQGDRAGHAWRTSFMAG